MIRDPILSLCVVDAGPTAPSGLWMAWSLAPESLVPLGVLLALALRGWTRGGGGRAVQRAYFLAGWCALFLALVSPLCRLAATLVSAHMAQFMVLALVAPLLLALARPGESLRAGLPQWLAGALPAGRRWARILPPGERLASVTAAYGAVVWLWHVPVLYERILTDTVTHVLAFTLLIVVSTAFWNAVINARGQEGRAMLALFATMAHTGLLGAILTFSARLLYPIQSSGALAWGLDPLHDQQLAGLIMWVPGGVLYLCAALALFARWLDRRGAVSI